MPYSFTQIEKDKSKTIWLVFGFLVLLYFFSFYCSSLAVRFYLYLEYNLEYDRSAQFTNFTGLETLGIILLAVIVGIGHWAISTHNLIDKILNIMRAEAPADNDSYHQMFKNIVEEVSVATGGIKIESVIVPSMSMNAFALSDFNGNHVIGVTEGLISRLPRAQIEAVVGHEAAHIVSGDCVSTTVTSSLFQMYAMMFKGFEDAVVNSRSGFRMRSSRRSEGSGILLVMFIYLILMLTKLLSDLMHMFISREREYRADAVAVRLTRDPVSLASALYAIGHKWRGSGLFIEEMEPVFIVNPKLSSFDECEGVWADLFATHPPLKKRISVLLDMARSDTQILEQNFQKVENRPRTAAPQLTASQPEEENRWLVHQEGHWLGPFNIAQFAEIRNFTPETWVKKIGQADVKFAYQEPDIVRGVIKEKEVFEDGIICPKCRVSLQVLHYEGVDIYQCGFCKGSLLPRKDAEKIIMRREIGFTPDIIHMGDKVIDQLKVGIAPNPMRMKAVNLYNCSICKSFPRKMMRKFYNGAYYVEIDECLSCGTIWFDYPELEVLQYMIEKNTSQLSS